MNLFPGEGSKEESRNVGKKIRVCLSLCTCVTTGKIIKTRTKKAMQNGEETGQIWFFDSYLYTSFKLKFYDFHSIFVLTFSLAGSVTQPNYVLREFRCLPPQHMFGV